MPWAMCSCSSHPGLEQPCPLLGTVTPPYLTRVTKMGTLRPPCTHGHPDWRKPIPPSYAICINCHEGVRQGFHTLLCRCCVGLWRQVGDGTTSVVIVAAELLKRANELIKNNIHPTTVMAGYRLALKEAVKYIKTNLCMPVDKLGR